MEMNAQDESSLYWNLAKSITPDNPAKCLLKTYYM